jgi:hypothetical protein
MNLLTKISLGFFVLSGLSACVSTPLPTENKIYERVFLADYDEVWRASQQAVISYPLKINNMEQGLIQTTPLRSHVYFKPPHLSQKHAGGYRYDLSVTILKMAPKKTKVSLEKNLQVYRDFISQPENLISDGLEETAILYRIQREIEMDRLLVKESKKK